MAEFSSAERNRRSEQGRKMARNPESGFGKGRRSKPSIEQRLEALDIGWKHPDPPPARNSADRKDYARIDEMERDDLLLLIEDRVEELEQHRGSTGSNPQLIGSAKPRRQEADT
jgi:hypothetical protein